SVDFNILVSNFGMTGLVFSQGNFNYDGTIDSIDFNLLAANFGDVVGASTAPAVALALPATAAGNVSAGPRLAALRPATEVSSDSPAAAMFYDDALTLL